MLKELQSVPLGKFRFSSGLRTHRGKTYKNIIAKVIILFMLFVMILIVLEGCTENPMTQSSNRLTNEAGNTPSPNNEYLFWTYPVLSVEARGEHYVEQQIESPFIKAGLHVVKICFNGSVDIGSSSYIPILTVLGDEEVLYTEFNIYNLNRYREISLDTRQHSQFKLKVSLWCDGKGDCTNAALSLSNIRVYIQ